MIMASVNPDLAKERATASFSPDDISMQLYGREGMKERRLAQQRAANDPIFKVAESFVSMPRDEIYDESIRLYCEFVKKCREYGYEQGATEEGKELNFSLFSESVFIDTVQPFGLHNSMFKTTVETQATEEQIKRWTPKIRTYEIIGTYAQTEMGHGTFLRGLETTATFDKQTDEFVLHSPTITSTKYWPGGLGKTANHAVVMANLIIDGKEYGMHIFMVQLRDIQTHQPMPGVELGDINRKFGYDNIDNGFLRFTNKRIPRNDLLMKFAKVDREGIYSRTAPPKLTYLTMVVLRWMIVLGSANDLAMAATIATRYSAVRRQTANSHGIEPQVLDYQTQQMKLMPAICTSYALFFTGLEIRGIYQEIGEAVQKGDASRLAEIHNLTSGMKAYATETASELIEVCRRSCGGHGYSHASGIPKIYLRCVPGCTYEGENTVMYLQCARSLLKFYGKAQAGEELPSTLKFLSLPSTIPENLLSAEVYDLDSLMLVYRYNSLLSVQHVAGQMQDSIYSDSVEPETAWNNHSQALADAARYQAMHITASMFLEALRDRQWEPRALAVMKLVSEFYMVHNIVEHAGVFMQNGVVNKAQLCWLQSRRVDLLTLLRPEAVMLVDAYDYTDRLLNSCLGKFDGQVYEALYEYAKSSSLNKTPVHPSFEKYIKPMRAYMKSMM